jgi:hypothetical protein
MWWKDLLRGFWNGLTAWVVLPVHACGGWKEYPVFDATRANNWYTAGFLLGAGSILRGNRGGGKRKAAWVRRRSGQYHEQKKAS